MSEYFDDLASSLHTFKTIACLLQDYKELKRPGILNKSMDPELIAKKGERN